MAIKFYSHNINNITFGDNRINTIKTTEGTDFNNTSLKITFTGTNCNVSRTSLFVRPGATVSASGTTLTIHDGLVTISITASQKTETNSYYYAVPSWSGFPATITQDITVTASATRYQKSAVTLVGSNSTISGGQQTLGIYIINGSTVTINGQTITFNETIANRTKSYSAAPLTETNEYYYAWNNYSNVPSSITEDITITANSIQYEKVQLTITTTNCSVSKTSPQYVIKGSTASVSDTTVTINQNGIKSNFTIVASKYADTAQYYYGTPVWGSIPSTINTTSTISATATRTLRYYDVELGTSGVTVNMAYGTTIKMAVNKTTLYWYNENNQKLASQSVSFIDRSASNFTTAVCYYRIRGDVSENSAYTNGWYPNNFVSTTITGSSVSVDLNYATRQFALASSGSITFAGIPSNSYMAVCPGSTTTKDCSMYYEKITYSATWSNISTSIHFTVTPTVFSWVDSQSSSNQYTIYTPGRYIIQLYSDSDSAWQSGVYAPTSGSYSKPLSYFINPPKTPGTQTVSKIRFKNDLSDVQQIDISKSVDSGAHSSGSSGTQILNLGSASGIDITKPVYITAKLNTDSLVTRPINTYVGFTAVDNSDEGEVTYDSLAWNGSDLILKYHGTFNASLAMNRHVIVQKISNFQ